MKFCMGKSDSSPPPPPPPPRSPSNQVPTPAYFPMKLLDLDVHFKCRTLTEPSRGYSISEQGVGWGRGVCIQSSSPPPTLSRKHHLLSTPRYPPFKRKAASTIMTMVRDTLLHKTAASAKLLPSCSDRRMSDKAIEWRRAGKPHKKQ